MTQLTFNQCLAENIKVLCQDLIPYLAKKTAYSIEFNPDLPYDTIMEDIGNGEIDFCWLCGLLYTELRDRQDMQGTRGGLEPLTAPILASPTSNSYTSATYSSYIIVHKNSDFKSIEDLHCKTLAINEEGSFSGNHLLRYCLKDSKLKFKLVTSGGHAKSIELVSSGQADTAAIDTTLYDYLTREKPEKLKNIRVLEKLPLFPMPPILVNQNLSEDIKSSLRSTLLDMPSDSEGKALLQKHAVQEFTPVTDKDYDPIRTAYKQGRALSL